MLNREQLLYWLTECVFWITTSWSKHPVSWLLQSWIRASTRAQVGREGIASVSYSQSYGLICFGLGMYVSQRIVGSKWNVCTCTRRFNTLYIIGPEVDLTSAFVPVTPLQQTCATYIAKQRSLCSSKVERSYNSVRTSTHLHYAETTRRHQRVRRRPPLALDGPSLYISFLRVCRVDVCFQNHFSKRPWSNNWNTTTVKLLPTKIIELQ